MESTTTAGEAGAEGDNNIQDIQNYLQSFNKEIGEGSSDGQQTFYAIDTSQLTGSEANNGDGSLQTVAIVPGQGGGYVLIVQPPGGGDGTPTQVQLPASAANALLAGGSITTHVIEDSESTSSNTPVTRSTRSRVKTQVKQEKTSVPEADISVYDFGPDADANHSAEGAGEEDGDEDEGEDEEFTTTPAKTPKKRAVGGASGKKGSAKKAKMQTPITPSNASSSSQHMCNYCSYTSSKRYLLSRHMKSHSEERPHKCGICERGFKTIASLQNHVNTHTGVRPHACKYCDAAFTTSGELVRHVRYRHTHEKPHRCSECDYASVELSKLKRHMRCHTGERPYQCPHCTYASPDTYKLKRHLRIHTGEKPYECDVCHARFTQSNSLKAHRLIHSGNKPIFKCELCPTTCGRKTDLRIHVQKLHTAEKPMTCKRCDQSFPDRYTFKLHLKSHEGEKCFKCDLCNYASVSARHLESHMLIHTDQKPFNCDECDQSFRQKQLLKRHKNLYHNPEYIPPAPKEKTHECAHCNKSFRHKGNLMRHLVIHDPDAYKDGVLQLRDGNDCHQLIDDEDEDEESLEEESDEDDDEGTAHLIQTRNVSAGNTTQEDESLDNQTLQFTLDPQTQQMLQGDQVVVFEVVQMNEDGEEGTTTLIEAQGDASTPTGKKALKKALRTATLVQNGSANNGQYLLQ